MAEVDMAPVPLGNIPNADKLGQELFSAALNAKSKRLSKILDRNKGKN